MRRDSKRTICGGIVRDQFEQYQTGPDQRLRKREADRQGCAEPDTMSLRVGAERPDEQYAHQQQGKAGREAMYELYHHLGLAVQRDHLSTACRPMRAAAVARKGSPHIDAPEDYGQIVEEQPPGVPGETGLCHRGTLSVFSGFIVPYKMHDETLALARVFALVLSRLPNLCLFVAYNPLSREA